MHGDAANNSIFVVDRDEELPDRLVKLCHRAPDHQLLVGKHENLFVDAGNITYTRGTNGQSRNLRGWRPPQASGREIAM